MMEVSPIKNCKLYKSVFIVKIIILIIIYSLCRVNSHRICHKHVYQQYLK
jgi:hypothetical protein